MEGYFRNMSCALNLISTVFFDFIIFVKKKKIEKRTKENVIILQ
jgi:hypothetical protein